MTTNEMRDPIFRLLAGLPPATPPATLDRRIRSRCHLALERQHRLPAHRSAIVPAGVITATLTIMAGIYAAAAALEALRLAGMLKP
jgi:hypothetical protein